MINPTFSCGICPWCLQGEESLCREVQVLGEHRPGAAAELLALPAENLARVPPSMPWTQAAAFSLATLTAFGRLTVPTGPHRIVAVAVQRGTIVGSQSTRVDLPVTIDLLRFSDVIVAASTPEPRQVVLPDKQLSRVLPAGPTRRRVFDARETLTAYVELTDYAGLLPLGVALRARVLSASGEVRWHREGTAKSPTSVPRVEYTVTIPLQRLEPGDYQLVFDAQAAGTDVTAVSRPLAFTVR